MSYPDTWFSMHFIDRILEMEDMALPRSYLININPRWDPCVFTLTLTLSHQGRGDKEALRSVGRHL